MADHFDPYHVWLGIPPGQRPPTHYQLLAISPGERERAVINAAVTRQSAYVRNFQAGKHAADAARILNEIQTAKLCLLDPAKRAEYDTSLPRQQPAPSPAAAAVAQSAGLVPDLDAFSASAAPLSPPVRGRTPALRRTAVTLAPRRPKTGVPTLWIVAAGVFVLVAALALGISASRRRSAGPIVPPVASREGAAPEVRLPPGAPLQSAPQEPAPKTAAVAPLPGVVSTADALPPETDPATAPAANPIAPVVESSAPEPETEMQPAALENGASQSPPPDAPKPAGSKDASSPAASSVTASPPPPESSAPPAEKGEQPALQTAPREDVPDVALLRDAERKIESRYQNHWRHAKKLVDRLGIPFLMVHDSFFAESAPLRYAALREASQRAAALGDAPVACEALDELQIHFGVDALGDQVEALRQAVTKLHDRPQVWSVIMMSLSLADLALRQDQLSSAESLVELAATAAKKSGNLAVRTVVEERADQVRRRLAEREEYAQALERLQTTPDDRAANLVAGRYECFRLGRWKQGLERLAKSSDATLANLSALERIAQADPSQAPALADAWQAAAAEAGAWSDDYLLEANFWRLPSSDDNAAPSAGAAQPIRPVGLARVEPGLIGALYNGADFQQPALRRVDRRLHFNFGFGSPDPALGGDNFSIRWTGWLNAPLAGKYLLHAMGDDGVRLWLDGKPVLDRWGGAGDERKEVELTAGLHALKMEYNEYGATAAVRLTWQLRELSAEFTVPAAALFHESSLAASGQ